MSALLIASAALLAVSASSSGGDGSCPVSDFGGVMIALFVLLFTLGVVPMIWAFCLDCFSKWWDRLMYTGFILWGLSVVPLVVGLIHDCQ